MCGALTRRRGGGAGEGSAESSRWPRSATMIPQSQRRRGDVAAVLLCLVPPSIRLEATASADDAPHGAPPPRCATAVPTTPTFGARCAYMRPFARAPKSPTSAFTSEKAAGVKTRTGHWHRPGGTPGDGGKKTPSQKFRPYARSLLEPRFWALWWTRRLVAWWNAQLSGGFWLAKKNRFSPRSVSTCQL